MNRVLPLRDTKSSESLSVSPSRPAERLSASARLAVGGVLWLLLSLAFSCWVQWRMHDTAPGPVSAKGAAAAAGSGSAAQHRAAFGLAASHAAWQSGNKTLALELLDSLVAQVLPRALPLAQWQRVLLPQNNESADMQAGGGAGDFSHAAGAGFSAANASAALSPAAALPSVSATQATTQAATQAATEPATADALRLFTVSGPCAPLRLGLALLEGLNARAEALAAAGARASVRWSPQGTLELLVNDLVYYVVSFPGHVGQLADLAQPLPQGALAIVIDDMGQGPDVAEEAAALPFAVTFAIWPRAPHAREVAEIAATRRLDCLLHQPMEPQPRADHRRPDPGPGALLINMSAQEIRAVINENLRALPTVIGLSNHMGSAFTGDISQCRTLAEILGGQGLAVLDSVTRSDPQLAPAAREAGMVALARDVFLDTRRDTAAILVALDAAAARARTKDMAVAIGHPHPETLRALRQWQDREGAAVVPLRRIIWKLAQDRAAGAARPHSLNTNMEKE